MFCYSLEYCFRTAPGAIDTFFTLISFSRDQTAGGNA